ncbi:hypothetical protein HMPREF3027_04885 [Porphyromonas sp. HMSC077F02]|nr:hypothetical protein HMPREF3027_04885 [Porphyromonas sp. HMSC077F02]
MNWGLGLSFKALSHQSTINIGSTTFLSHTIIFVNIHFFKIKIGAKRGLSLIISKANHYRHISL